MPELLNVILLHCDKFTLVVCVRVSRFWRALAESIIWYEIDEVAHLFSLLGPLVKDEDTGGKVYLKIYGGLFFD